MGLRRLARRSSRLGPGVTSAGLTSAAPASFTQIGGGAPDTVGNYDEVAGSTYGYFDVGAAVFACVLSWSAIDLPLASRISQQFDVCRLKKSLSERDVLAAHDVIADKDE